MTNSLLDTALETLGSPSSSTHLRVCHDSVRNLVVIDAAGKQGVGLPLDIFETDLPEAAVALASAWLKDLGLEPAPVPSPLLFDASTEAGTLNMPQVLSAFTQIKRGLGRASDDLVRYVEIAPHCVITSNTYMIAQREASTGVNQAVTLSAEAMTWLTGLDETSVPVRSGKSSIQFDLPNSLVVYFQARNNSVVMSDLIVTTWNPRDGAEVTWPRTAVAKALRGINKLADEPVRRVRLVATNGTARIGDLEIPMPAMSKPFTVNADYLSAMLGCMRERTVTVSFSTDGRRLLMHDKTTRTMIAGMRDI